MDNFFKFLQARKILVATVGGVLIVILILIALFISAKPKTHSLAIQPTPTSYPSVTPLPSSQATGMPSVSTSPVPSQNDWNTFRSATYTMAYPPDWQANVGAVVGGGELVRVTPKVLPSGYYYPAINIEYDPAMQTPLANRISLLQGLGFTRSAVTIAGVSAVKLTGTLSQKKYAQYTVNSPIQNGTIFLERNNNQYVIKYEYDGARIDDQLDNYFMQLLGTIKFTK